MAGSPQNGNGSNGSNGRNGDNGASRIETERARIGRPPLDFESQDRLDLARKCGQLGCTYEEMGFFFDCSTKTIQRLMEQDPPSAFCLCYKKGDRNARASLRRAQQKLALKGDRVMLIWLGKQRLGQRDEVNIESHHTEEIRFTVCAEAQDDQNGSTPSGGRIPAAAGAN